MLKDSRFWPPLLKFRENPDPKPEKGRWEGEGVPKDDEIWRGGRSRKMTKTQKKIEDAIKLYIKKRSTQKIFRKKN